MSDYVVRVDEDMLKGWAEGALQDWLTGYTHDPGQPRYKITWLGEDTYKVSGTFPNTSMKSKRFIVQVSVTQL